MDYSNISFSYDNYIFKLSNQATDIDDYIYKSSYNTSDFGEDSDEFVFRVYDNVAFENYKNKIKILPLNKNSTEIHEFELYDDTETCDVYFNKISKNKILVEKKKEVENNDANNSSIVLEGGEYYEYSYFVIDFSGEQPIKNNVDIKDGYTKVYSVEIGQNGDSVESYFLRQEKVNATLSTSNSAQYVYQYFDKDNKLIFEYESNSSEEILKSDGVNFLTNKRIFNLTTGNIVVSKVLFEDLGISVQNAEYQENVFLYSKNGSYGLMNLDGTMLSSDNNNDDATILFSKIYPEKEGFAICKNNYYDHDEYYIVNLSTGERKLIDNMYYDQNMEKLLEFGSGIYFTKDQVKGTLLLYENETLKFSNIQSYKFSTKMKNAALVEFYVSQSGNIDYLVKISGTGIDLSLNNDLNQYNVVGYEIKPYSITSIVIKDSDGHERGKGSAWDNDYGFLGTDHDYKWGLLYWRFNCKSWL